MRQNANSRKLFRSADAQALVDVARDILSRNDYIQALEVLESVPGSHRDEEVLELMEDAREIQEEVDFLIADMEDAKRTKQYLGLDEKLYRLLELRPGYAPARLMLEELATYQKDGRTRKAGKGDARYNGEDGIGGTMMGVFAGAFVLGLLVLGATIFYLQNSAGTVRVTVYDPSVKVTLDNSVLKLSAGETVTEVRAGDHTLVIQHGGLKILATDFTIEKGDQKVFRVELVSGELKLVEGQTPFQAPANNSNQPPVDPGAVAANNPPVASANPQTLNGQFVMTAKGQFELFVNGKPLATQGLELPDERMTKGTSDATTLKVGDIVVIRHRSKWTYKGAMVAFIGDNGGSVSFRVKDLLVIPDDTDFSSLTAASILSSGTPAVSRPPDNPIKQLWAERALTNLSSEWFWYDNTKSSNWGSVATVLTADMFSAASTQGGETAPAPAPAVAEDLRRSGLIGTVTVNGVEQPVIFRNQHGKVFQGTAMDRFTSLPDIKRNGIVVTMRGQVTIPVGAKVKAYSGGGTTNGGVNYLIVDGKTIHEAGDDRSKDSLFDIDLAHGVHEIEWKLVGPTFGASLIRFTNADTGEQFPVTFRDSDIPKGANYEIILVSADTVKWPIPTGRLDTAPAWDPAEIAKLPLQ